jgi:uncharacterized protein YdeI (YjbR/CyaY-like superfamily)
MHTDPRVDAYIAKAADFARPILEHVRVLAHTALPELEETLKWGVPHFTVGGKNAVGMAAFKGHAAVIIHGEDAAPEGMGNLGKLASLDELPGDEELMARFKTAAAAIASGKPRRPAARPKPEIAMPGDFAQALAAAPKALATFEALAPSHRREYLEWITGAKREETRTKRLATAIEWLAEGKKRNWKYENC